MVINYHYDGHYHYDDHCNCDNHDELSPETFPENLMLMTAAIIMICLKVRTYPGPKTMLRRKKNSQKVELFSERKRKTMMRREKNSLNSFFERKRRRRQSFETFGQLAAGDYTNALHSFTQTDDDDDDDDDDSGESLVMTSAASSW